MIAFTDRAKFVTPDLPSSHMRMCDHNCGDTQALGDVKSARSEIIRSDMNIEDDEAENLLVISEVILKDPLTDQKLCWKNEPCGTSPFIKCFEKQSCGLSLQHGIPKTIRLEPTRRSLIGWLLNKFAPLVAIIARFSMFWLFFDGNVIQPVTSNFSRFEKMSILIFAVSNTFLMDVLYHGMEEPDIYFVAEETGVMESYLGNYMSVTKAFLFVTSAVVIAFITILSEHLAGKWNRVIEDPFSYWQGLHPILAFLHNVLMAFASVVFRVNVLVPKELEKESKDKLDLKDCQRSEIHQHKKTRSFLNPNVQENSVSRIPSTLFILGTTEKVGTSFPTQVS